MTEAAEKVGILRLYREMLKIRMIEERIASEYKHQEMRCPVHLSVGQEAVPVGVSAALHEDDHVVSAHRSHAHYLAKGGDLKAMLCELFGKNGGCAGGRGGSMHLIDLDANVTAAVPIVGSSISIGTGIGFGLKLSSSQRKVVVYFGDGATEEGVFAESLDFAVLNELPVLFVCENNFYSVYTSLEQRQGQERDLQQICAGYGIKSFFCDGNDVMAIRSTAQDALDYMEKNQKPALIECPTFRWLEHCGPNWDDHLGYRKEGELDTWMAKCPLEHSFNVLKKAGHLNEEWLEETKIEINQEIDYAFAFARTNEFPDPESLYDNIYSEKL